MTFQRISRVAGVLLLLGAVLLFGVAVAAATDNWQQAMSPGMAPDACDTYGAIGAVYNATGGVDGPLGDCITKELRAERGDGSDSEIDHAVHANKYQIFETGAIFYNDKEGTAFALSKTLYDLFKAKGAIGAYGLPIASENFSGSSCKGYFQKGYIFCDDSSGLWAGMSSSAISSLLTFPSLKLPYGKDALAKFASGPHAWNNGDFWGSFSYGDGSGLDFSAAKLNVLAMASGTVIEVSKVSDCDSQTTGLGCWVSIRNDFSGTVITYGHLYTITNEFTYSKATYQMAPGTWIPQGVAFANTGPVGATVGKSDGPHVHVQLWDGTGTNGSGGRYGNPVEWSGVPLDGYLISAYKRRDDAAQAYNYDGLALKMSVDPSRRHEPFSEFSSSGTYAVANMYFQEYGTAAPTREATSLMPKTYVTPCAGYEASGISCEKPTTPVSDIYFSGGGVLASSNVTPQAAAAAVEGGAALPSSNVERPFVPRYVPPYPGDLPPIPSNGDTCPTDNRPGVYFYAQPNYQPACVFSTVDVPAFSATTVGDNNLRSVRVVGDYQVKLYREISFGGGAYEELNSSEGDITWRSMGTDVSSARVINKAVQSNCPTDNRNGVYLYADRDLAGACHFTTTDVADLGTTAVGDNNVSSAKIVGYYTVKLYENTSFGGRSDELNGNGYKEELNLDVRSLGGAYSSLRISAQAGADLVSNIRVASGRSYQWNKCKIGAPYYTDRSYVIDSVSQDDYSNLWCIRTANDDKDRSDKELLSFELNRNATIYVYFDRRMTAAPSWVGTLYNQNSKRIYTSDNDMDYFVVYSCKSTPGAITLGGPHYDGGTGAKSMYVVAFREENSASQFCNGTFPVPPTPTYTPAPTPTATEVFPTPVPPPTTVPEITDAHLFAEQGAITAGQPARFTIVVYNAGSLDSVALAAQLPPGLRYMEGSASNGATYDLAAHQIRWVGTIFNSQTLVIQFGALLTDTSLPAVTVNLTVAGQGAGVVAESAVIQVAPPATSTPTATPDSVGQPPGPDSTPVPPANHLYLPSVTK